MSFARGENVGRRRVWAVLMSFLALMLAAFLLWQALLGNTLGADDADQALVIVREAHLEVPAQQIRQMYPEVRQSLEDALGWTLSKPPRVVLTTDTEMFEKMSGSPLVSAFAVPQHHSIVMLLSSAAPDSYLLHETLEHELCHLLLHEHINARLLPKWLDEGICQWLSGSLGEILAGQGLVTTGINLARYPISLHQLTKSFPADSAQLLQAYEESRRFVDFLIAGYGRDGLLTLLERLKAGEEITEAMPQVFSNSLESLEAEWLQGLRGRNLWLLWLSQYLYEILFFVGALLTVLGFVRLMRRKRAYDLEEDGEE